MFLGVKKSACLWPCRSVRSRCLGEDGDGAVASAVLAGAASALSIISKGIPEDYQAAPESPNEGEGFVARG